MSDGGRAPASGSVDLSRLAPFPALSRLVNEQRSVWPDHAKYLGMRFNDDPPDFLARVEEVANLALMLIGPELNRFCEDYKWMCLNFTDEELYFRRHKTYRLKTFEDANRQIYSNQAYMSRYVNGILLSQIFWHNHTMALDLFRTQFLPTLPIAFEHVEVGPGHGLFLAFAASDPRCKGATGWDVSRTSLEAAGRTLDKFGVTAPVTLTQQDILAHAPQAGHFDSALISEVLEHLETPDLALKTLFESLRSGGRIFVNVPINSPAPDHIYLWTEPEQIVQLVAAVGFQVERVYQLPMTGYSLERARDMSASISCVVFASKP